MARLAIADPPYRCEWSVPVENTTEPCGRPAQRGVWSDEFAGVYPVCDKHFDEAEAWERNEGES